MNSLDKPPLQSFLTLPWLSIADFFANFNATAQDWVIGIDQTIQNPFFRTQWVSCLYQPSGSYGPTSRFTFYALAALSIFARMTSWVVTVALVSFMIYSSTAAIHAIVAAVAAMVQLTTWLAAIKENYEVVLIDGTTQTGNLE
jgi:hypothetical protein